MPALEPPEVQMNPEKIKFGSYFVPKYFSFVSLANLIHFVIRQLTLLALDLFHSVLPIETNKKMILHLNSFNF